MDNMEGAAAPYAAIFHHRAVRSARRDDGKYAATPFAGARPRNAPKVLNEVVFCFFRNWDALVWH